MPKARLRKDWFDGRQRRFKGDVVTVAESVLARDEERTVKNPGRTALFERMAEPEPEQKPAARPARAAVAQKPAQAPSIA